MIMKYLKALNWVAYIFVGLFALRFVVFDTPFLVYKNSPFPVVNSPVHAGEAARIIVMRCSEADELRVYRVSHALHGASDKGAARHASLPATLAQIEPGCKELSSAVNVIPPDTPTGRYYLDGYAEVAGVLRTHLVYWRTRTFDVVAAKTETPKEP